MYFKCFLWLWKYICWKYCHYILFFGCISYQNFGQNQKYEPKEIKNCNAFYGWPNPLALVNKNSQTTSIYRVISFISSELFRGTCYFGNVWWTTISNNMWHNIMSKAILGFGFSVTRLAALAGSKLASTPSNDDIVKCIPKPNFLPKLKLKPKIPDH
jgi:hypothetical protein